MVYLIAQLSDIHIGGPRVGSGERFSLAIKEINAMTRQPDLVLLTGDLTQSGEADEWAEFCQRLDNLHAPWELIPGNHDIHVESIAGHRSREAGPFHLVLLDTSTDQFTDADAVWLDNELGLHHDTPTIIAIHQPPFETGIWWMDCVGLQGSERVERVVRKHPQVVRVLSGHVHRLIQSNWGSCVLWVCPSTYVTIAVDLDHNHDPAESAEEPSFSLHAYNGISIVSHLVPIGASAARNSIGTVAPEFVAQVRSTQANRRTTFRDA
jgi:3',5'-cyclic-AMP phosphodiesterase